MKKLLYIGIILPILSVCAMDTEHVGGLFAMSPETTPRSSFEAMSPLTSPRSSIDSWGSLDNTPAQIQGKELTPQGYYDFLQQETTDNRQLFKALSKNPQDPLRYELGLALFMAGCAKEQWNPCGQQYFLKNEFLIILSKYLADNGSLKPFEELPN